MAWERVRGHERIVEDFGRAAQRGRLAHAYLFVGPPGIGKRLFAEELARSLLCEASSQFPSPLGGEREGVRGVGVAACDQCAGCVMVAARTHPDFFEVARPEDKNVIPIDIMRELCQNFSLKSARGRGKVAILDDADDLDDVSANCFLKTLEEPPPRSVFILVGSNEEQQLPTVVSRCQVIRFAPLPGQTVAEILRGQGSNDDIESLTRKRGASLAYASGFHDEQQLKKIVRLSEGSPGQALQLADPALWEFRQVFLNALAEPHLDTLALSKAFVEFVEDAGKETALHRRRAALFLRLLLAFLKDALAQSVGEAPPFAPPLSPEGRGEGGEDARSAAALLRRLNTDALLRLLDRCLETERQLDRYAQVALIVESLVDAIAGEL